MGGNLRLGAYAAQQIDLTNNKRAEITKDLWSSLDQINKYFKKKIGLNLWSPTTFSKKLFLSGSSKHFFDDSIPDDTFVTHKKKVGDIDTMIDINMKDLVKKGLESIGQFETIGELEFIGFKESAGQYITLWRLAKYDLNVQIDLEQVEFKSGKPTSWAIFSHASAWADMQQGVKGAMHKKLLAALNAKNLINMVLQMKTKTKEITAAPHTFSIYGFREKYKKNKEGTYSEVADSQYDKDLNSIFKKIFGHSPAAGESDKFWSFVGTVELCQKYMNDEEKKKVLEGFIYGVFGPTAQGLYVDDPGRDLEEKMSSVKYLAQHLKVQYNNDNLVKLQTQFYKSY